ncbi:hypothetical protein BDV29DRAFT_167067 [Aspergillus leporis]|uniref:Uncharacterized protein n=1 Tax=Aspergillus leporis TaxID=41062 RepID=A0A5N5XB48_9EURO|nr:hypothetical protein BDV29DRAFT_167067 [Aspergillus leporis]
MIMTIVVLTSVNPTTIVLITAHSVEIELIQRIVNTLKTWLRTTPSISIQHGLSIALLLRLWVLACGFLLMYRAKKDGPALLGWKHPWEH